MLTEMNRTTHVVRSHDDVIKWKRFPRYWPFVRGIHRSPVNSPHNGQWRGALMFALIYAWINGWVNNRDVGHLRRHRAHYDVIVMFVVICLYFTDIWENDTTIATLTAITVTSWWTRCCLKSPTSWLFTQPFIQGQIKENTKAPRHWPVVRGIHHWPVNSPHKGPVTRKMFPFDDVILWRHPGVYFSIYGNFNHVYPWK